MVSELTAAAAVDLNVEPRQILNGAMQGDGSFVVVVDKGIEGAPKHSFPLSWVQAHTAPVHAEGGSVRVEDKSGVLEHFAHTVAESTAVTAERLNEALKPPVKARGH